MDWRKKLSNFISKKNLLPQGPPPFFRILKTEKGDRRILFETLYMPLAKDRLGDFGTVTKVKEETRWGLDLDGVAPRPWLFVEGQLDVAPNYDLKRAIVRAKSLETINLEDVQAIIFQFQQEEPNQDPFQPRQVESLQGKVFASIFADAKHRNITVETFSPDLPGRLEGLGTMHSARPVTQDKHYWRFFIVVPPSINFEWAYNKCFDEARQLAAEITDMSKVWDVWNKPDDTQDDKPDD